MKNRALLMSASSEKSFCNWLDSFDVVSSEDILLLVGKAAQAGRQAALADSIKITVARFDQNGGIFLRSPSSNFQ
ncbi:hypothetical protein F2P44_34035 [Massilia sp. CCM 8695]|uniref:Uncharacterized protein n=1 Tax=Massilia frigida TaxID=2609281 RepID=A0ABX0NKS4_9BURK|nr:hypothetical protein [Massilia frigida]